MTAALYHVEFGVCQRSRGDSAVKVAAYSAAARYEDGDRVYDFTRKSDEHRATWVMLPDDAPDWARDGAELARRMEAAEKRADAQTARLVELSIPREITPGDREAFVRHVVQPWIDDGMSAQVSIHCPVSAADGQEQPHAHVVLTLRRFDGEDFDGKKERGWNQAFQADKGRAMRAAIAKRMNAWLNDRGLESRVDHRTHAEQGIDERPERDVSRKAWDTFKADPGHPAAEPVRTTLAERDMRRQLRRARHVAEAANREGRALLTEWESRQPGLRGPRRRRPGQPLAWSDDWTPPVDAPHIRAVERGPREALLTLADGGAVVDRGDRLILRGHVSDASLAALADQAARHGWQSVQCTGDPAFRDRLAAALKVRGIDATNCQPSRAALKAAERQLAADRPTQPPVPLAAPTVPVASAPAPRLRAAQPDPSPSYAPAPAFRPPWVAGPKKPENRKK